MTEEIASTPGWVEERLDHLFADLPTIPALRSARAAYASCLAERKAPAAPSDMLGAEFAPCRPPLHTALRAAGIDAEALSRIELALEALEAEIGEAS